MKVVYFICSSFLVLGAFKLPIGYYTFLRIIVTIGTIIALIEAYDNSGFGFWTIGFAIVGILFNPIFPVYLHDKETWVVIDIVAALLFAVFGFQSKYKEIRRYE